MSTPDWLDSISGGDLLKVSRTLRTLARTYPNDAPEQIIMRAAANLVYRRTRELLDERQAARS